MGLLKCGRASHYGRNVYVCAAAASGRAAGEAVLLRGAARPPAEDAMRCHFLAVDPQLVAPRVFVDSSWIWDGSWSCRTAGDAGLTWCVGEVRLSRACGSLAVWIVRGGPEQKYHVADRFHVVPARRAPARSPRSPSIVLARDRRDRIMSAAKLVDDDVTLVRVMARGRFRVRAPVGSTHRENRNRTVGGRTPRTPIVYTAT